MIFVLLQQPSTGTALAMIDTALLHCCSDSPYTIVHHLFLPYPFSCIIDWYCLSLLHLLFLVRIILILMLPSIAILANSSIAIACCLQLVASHIRAAEHRVHFMTLCHTDERWENGCWYWVLSTHYPCDCQWTTEKWYGGLDLHCHWEWGLSAPLILGWSATATAMTVTITTHLLLHIHKNHTNTNHHNHNSSVAAATIASTTAGLAVVASTTTIIDSMIMMIMMMNIRNL